MDRYFVEHQTVYGAKLFIQLQTVTISQQIKSPWCQLCYTVHGNRAKSYIKCLSFVNDPLSLFWYPVCPWFLWWPPTESHYNAYDHSAVGYVTHAHCTVLLYSVENCFWLCFLWSAPEGWWFESPSHPLWRQCNEGRRDGFKSILAGEVHSSF